MTMRLNLFIGGPGHAAHKQMVNRACSDPHIRTNFDTVKAFDDEQAKAASEGAANWRNYLRNCDVAVFLLPATKSGAREPHTSKFYTQLEVKQAHLSGTLIYLLIELGNHEESELVSEVKAIYNDELAYIPIRVEEGCEVESNEVILAACMDALLSAVTHWNALMEYIKECRLKTIELIRQAGQAVDAKTAQLKARTGTRQEKKEEVVQEYLAECWNLRRQCPKSPELPRHLLRAFLCVVRPCLQPQDIEYAIAGSDDELWNRLAGLLVPCDPTSSSETTIPKPSLELFKWLADWRQRALITCLREVSVAFRYRLKLAEDWTFAKHAFYLYRTRTTDIDPYGYLLFNLAISVVDSATCSLNLHELSEIDRSGSMLTVLENRYNRYRDPGAAYTLAAYYATLGKMEEAKLCLRQSIIIRKEAQARTTGYIHSLIALACCETGVERDRIFANLNKKMPNWLNNVHPIYSAIATEAQEHRDIGWRDIWSGIANP